MGLFRKHCWTNSSPVAVPPNPDPCAWTILETVQFSNAYVLKVRYTGCTNYEGIKVMVYSGTFSQPKLLDPHFRPELDSPIARFAPTEEGWKDAKFYASHK